MHQNHLVHLSELLIPSPPHTCTFSYGFFCLHISKQSPHPAQFFLLLRVSLSLCHCVLAPSPASDSASLSCFMQSQQSQPAGIGDQTDYQEGHAVPLLSPAVVLRWWWWWWAFYCKQRPYSLSLPEEPHHAMSASRSASRSAVLSSPACHRPVRLAQSCTCTAAWTSV